MKLLHLSFPYQYTQDVEQILSRHRVETYALHPRASGRDRSGRHDGSQVFPGYLAVVQAEVADDAVEDLLEDLRRFREERRTRGHLRALVLPVEQGLFDQAEEED